jgi:hypothetical protein
MTMAESLLYLYFIVAPVLVGRYTRWNTALAALLTGIGYLAVAFSLELAGLLSIPEGFQTSWLALIAAFWPLVAVGRWFRSRAERRSSKPGATVSKPIGATPIEQAPPARANKVRARRAVAALGAILVFVLMLCGAYQCGDRIRGWMAGTATPTTAPTAAPTPTKMALELSTYTNDEAHITISYPKGWQLRTEPNVVVDESSGGTAYGIQFYPEDVSRVANVLCLKGSGFADYASLSAMLGRFLSATISETQKSPLGGVTVQTWPELTVDDWPAVGASYSAPYEGSFQFWVITLTATDEHLYVLTWMTEADETDQLAKTMLASIHFLP